jgi:protein-L-isoaspartate(D-aspartate) O-methyltransferase
MVKMQLVRRGVRSREVLEAMRRVPREAFLEPDFKAFAYEDRPLPIGERQTISQPYVVALMLEAAQMTPGDCVLEVGAGSGYTAAIMSRIVDYVYAVERYASLAASARQRYATLHYENIELRVSDGTKGWPEAAPFDAILVSAGGPAVPPALKEQLAVGGRLVIPVGEKPHRQRLLRLTRTSINCYEKESFGPVNFVPLVGVDGWAEDHPRAVMAPTFG